jgi:hypothetical protein
MNQRLKEEHTCHAAGGIKPENRKKRHEIAFNVTKVAKRVISLEQGYDRQYKIL